MATFTERLALLISAKDDGATRTLKKVGGASDKTGKQVDATTKKVHGLSTAMTVGLGIAAGVVGAKLLQFSGQAIKAASDLAETQNKVNVVFGESADAVLKMGETSAKSLGLSENAAEGAAAAFGNMFTTTGLAQSEAADMSVTMVRLASDMASFNNEDPTEMLDKLRSGLAGEAEPLRRFGVLLSESAVQAKAVELGLADANGAVSQGAKVQARYAIILEQTKVQQGDFARTADGLANKQRIMNAQWEDAKAKLGAGLLPAMTAATGVAAKMAEVFADMDPTLRLVALGLAGVTTAAVIAVPAIRGVSAALSTMGVSAGTAVKGLGLVGLALVEVSQATSLATDTWDVWNNSQDSYALRFHKSVLAGLKVTTFGMIDLTDKTEKATGSAQGFADSLDDLIRRDYAALNATKTYTETLADQNKELDDAWEKQQRLNGALITATETQIQFADHLADGVQTIKESVKAEESHARSLSLTNKAGRENVSWLIDGVKLANDHAAAKLKETGSITAANTALRADVKALKAAAEAAGLNKKQVQELIDKYLKVPAKSETTIKQPGMPKALTDAAALKSKMESIDGRYETKVKVITTGLASLLTLSNVIARINGVRVNIPVSAITARQHGGMVNMDKPYLVGEKGGEILYKGRVYPSGKTPPELRGGSGGGITFTGDIHLHGVQNPREFVAKLRDYVRVNGRGDVQRALGAA